VTNTPSLGLLLTHREADQLFEAISECGRQITCAQLERTFFGSVIDETRRHALLVEAAEWRELRHGQTDGTHAAVRDAHAPDAETHPTPAQNGRWWMQLAASPVTAGIFLLSVAIGKRGESREDGAQPVAESSGGISTADAAAPPP
jgi:hypothetical protein